MTRPQVRNRELAVYGGIGCVILGSWLLWDAYEARGRQRPFGLKLLPGA